MTTFHRIAAVSLLALASCGTTGVQISKQESLGAVGKTAAELRDLYGAPHGTSLDSEGIEKLSYEFEKYRMWSTEVESRVEFTLVDGRVTSVCYRHTSQVADKN